MIAIPPSWLVAGVASIAVIGYGWHCEKEKREAREFIAMVEAVGKAAQAVADKRIADERRAKEKADAQSQADRARVAALSRELRDARARSNILPPASPLAASPGRAAFDRAELERTLQRLDAGVSDLLAEGDAARVDLDAARTWAKGIQ